MRSKDEFITKLSERSGLTKKASRELLDDVLAEIKSSLVQDGGVKFSGFGKFETKLRDSRVYKNPLTGEKFVSEACMSIKFSPSSTLKELVR